MGDEWSRAEKAGAVILAGLALALMLIAADILIGQKMFKRGCCDDKAEAVTDEP